MPLSASIRSWLRRFPRLYRFARGVDERTLLRRDALAFARSRYRRRIRALSDSIRSGGMAAVTIADDGTAYLRTRDGLLISYNTDDLSLNPGDGQSLDLRMNQLPTRLEEVFLGFCDRAATYIDVGANNGYYYVLKVARRRPAMRVIAVEPDPGILPLLERNLEINGVADRVTVVPVALTDHSGEARLTAHQGASGFVVRGNPEGIATIGVRSTTLDELVSGLGLRSVDVMKVDIEGGEHAFLRGAVRTIEESRPVMLLELNDQLLRRSGSSAGEVVAVLRGHAYRIFAIADSSDVLALGERDPALPDLERRTWLREIG